MMDGQTARGAGGQHPEGRDLCGRSGPEARADEGFNKGILHGFAWPNEVKLDNPPIGPIFKRSRLEFRPVIQRDGTGASRPIQGSIEDVTYLLP
jgi:hypothetical protein